MMRKPGVEFGGVDPSRLHDVRSSAAKAEIKER